MNILVAPDKFKGTLTARQVCDAIRSGLLKRFPQAIITTLPLADGGEGTCELLTEFFGGTMRSVRVNNPLFEPIRAEYGLDKKGGQAFIEMAKASGLQLLLPAQQNPLHTTTLGTGELILDAIRQGARKIILGIGGSATNDAGLGMAEALGFGFFDRQGNKLKPTGENLVQLHSIETENVRPDLKDVEFIALCDVSNPLHGPSGAAYVYGPQKGANEKAVKVLDEGLQNFEKVVRKISDRPASFPGAGAGGGLAGGVHIFLNAKILRGMDYIAEAMHLEERIKQADFVITGEGKMDSQTLAGKVVHCVAQLGNKNGKKVLAVCGQCELTSNEIREMGLSKVISLVREFTTVEEARENAFELIEQRMMEVD